MSVSLASRPRLWRLAPLLLLVAAGCRGPSAEEIASSVLMAAPVIYLLTWLTLWGLHRLWRRRERRDARMPARPTCVLLGLAVVGAGVGLIAESRGVGLLPLALWGAGASHLTLVLVIWRVWFALGKGSFAYAQLAPAATTTFFGVAGLLGSRDLSEVAFFYWLIPGYAGLITGPLLLAALLEALIRGRPR